MLIIIIIVYYYYEFIIIIVSILSIESLESCWLVVRMIVSLQKKILLVHLYVGIQ